MTSQYELCLAFVNSLKKTNYIVSVFDKFPVNKEDGTLFQRIAISSKDSPRIYFEFENGNLDYINICLNTKIRTN